MREDNRPQRAFRPAPRIVLVLAAAALLSSLGGTQANDQEPYADDPPMPAYRLPEVLRGQDGAPVTTAAAWKDARRNEVLELFRTNVYGRVPATSFEQSFHVTHEDPQALDGKATLRLVDVRLTRGEKQLTIRVHLFVPNGAAQPVPAFLLICNRGAENIDPTRRTKSEFWPVEEGIARGYAMAAFLNADVDPDRHDGFQNGIHGLLDETPRPADAWGTIAAWAFGASRVLDYLQTVSEIDQDRVAVIGHSRGGKTALWAAAEDQRFAMAVSNDSGCGGAALSRRRFAGREQVARIVTAFPHWFCAKFASYADREDELPVDQHELIALIAPRAVAVGSASEDRWADPRGEFLSLVHAAPVYDLFGQKSLGTTEMPAIGGAIHGERAHYHLRAGKHNLTLADWQHYWDFADRVLVRDATTQAAPDEASLPPPGTRGNADNVRYIGKSDPQGNPVRLARATGHVSNYTPGKIPAFTLPDPLLMANGERVATAEQWFAERRGQILKFYQDEIYGRVPATAPQVTWQVTETDDSAREGAAIRKRVVGALGTRPGGPQMNLTLHLPAKAERPVPVLLSLSFGFGGGRRAGARPGAAKTGSRPGDAFDPVAEVLRHGWGHATLNYSEIQPDRADRWTEGVIGVALADGQSRPAADEWGTISAWAWGLSRAIDYLETDPAVNGKQIAITGASRLGKTALWAGAQDERVAAVFAVVPGEMGASLIRRDWGETLDDMAQNFPWQFAGNFQKWVGKWNDLPVDQHMLIALCAPRPVYVNGGLSDQWSDPEGEFLALVAAGPVYQLVGARDLGVTELPPLDRPLIGGGLAFHYHSSGHTAVPADWKAFLEFAELHFQAATAAK